VNKKAYLMLGLAILMMASCSNIPKRTESQAKQKARIFLEQGRKEELKLNYPDALSLFQDAEHNATLASDLDLILISMQGEARIAFFNADSIGYKSVVNKMDTLVRDVSNSLGYRVAQLKLWENFHSGKYSEVLAIDYDLTKLPLNVRIEVLSYIIQAKSRLNTNAKVEQIHLINSISKYHIRLKRKLQIQPELISNAYYSLSYADAASGNYSKALSWISKAKALDRDYDLYILLADYYSLAGKCEMKLNNFVKAKANFTMARQIYIETQRLDEARNMEILIEEVSGK
jgi:hypothetical protein